MRFLKSALPFVASAFSLLSLQVAARSQEPSAIQHVSILEHAVINTPSHEVDHLTDFDVTFELPDKHQTIKLELEPNHDILADDAYVQYLDAEGNIHREEPIQRHEHKVFKGRSLLRRDNGLWKPVGWARIYVQRDGYQPLFEGVFSVDNDNHHVELKSTYLQKKRVEDASIPDRKDEYMVVYRDSDMIRQVRNELKRSLISSSSCQADKLGFNSDPQHPIFRSEFQDMDSGTSSYGSMSLNSLFGLSKRQSDIGGVSGNAGGVNLAQTIGSTSGCPKTKQVALVGIAADCSFRASFDNDDAAKQWIINVVNSASDVYEKSFNISIGLRNLTITDKTCPATAPASTQWNMPCDQSNITQRLNLFSQWRGQQSDGNAYWTLMSNCPTGTEVGLAWLGQLCNAEVTGDGSNSVSGANVVVRVSGGGWQVFAHESGHTFGAVHDCDSMTCAQNLEASSQCCPYSSGACDANGKYIMNPSTGTDITAFSPCTIGNICSALGRNSVKSSCLSDNRNVVTYTGSQCGNGIVEAGEDCDCGGESSCGNNPCCDAKTCKFKNGAVCDDANDSCCSQCQFSSAGTICRASLGECDLQETCTGNSSTCPADSFKKDGEQCGNISGLTCASGQCTSRDYQCRSVMGSLIHDNNTYACPQFDSSCELICTSPSLGSCFSINQNFLDGTPCGSGGYCHNGRCDGSNIGSWIEEHKNIVIGVACGVGGLLVLSILWCLINRCRRPRTVVKRPPMRPWPGPMPPPPPQMGQWAGPNRGYQGLRAEPPPPYPGPYQPATRYA
ncbi:disintegrin and metalloproteinase domain-containing protein B [Aspergillus lentulus]|uniref:Disintegrin and metalloproteinase domain-containing protein B n=1 Tax=Aspergillus lentulus TaxID=293939 RepID=A0ABQ0ZQY0_ASPLE|nr:disintegrin and metalloproteinase domain-containing protein B [Aspergillus lentulus]GFF61339.1 disintegrin and metalloproteinase domain-containing protein B [Aspergillus lentulus]GFF62971.1 disintegrin and metalloproteinase domain-containing protein B [Aspergillus lentulus]GFF98339.1 disintegrin and metalloproteinase domain-containing protein B [Aspergillus lentulus]